MIALPAGFHVARVDLGPGDDRHACGRRAARAALEAAGIDPARLAYEGPRPVVTGDRGAVSITHGRTVALAVAATGVTRIGIDVCDHDPRLPGLAPRFLVEEHALATSVGELAACFAAKEAALKALGLGLVDGGVLDGTAVTIVSLAPPTLSQADLHLVLGQLPEAAVAVVYGA